MHLRPSAQATWLTLGLFLICSTPLAALVALATPHVDAGEEIAHPGHCPDGDSEGSPCEAGCPCLCCPGHARLLPPEGHAIALSARLGGHRLHDGADALQPQEVFRGVFRPPRRS